MVRHRNVRTAAGAIAAAIGNRRIADHVPYSNGKRRVASNLIRVAQALEPLNVVGPWAGQPLGRIVERQRKRSAVAHADRRSAKPRVEPPSAVSPRVVADLRRGRRRSMVREIPRIVRLQAAVVREREAGVLRNRRQDVSEAPIVRTTEHLEIERVLR